MRFRSDHRKLIAALVGAGALTFSQTAAATEAVAPSDLSKLSIEELGDIKVTSVSKRAESVGEAPSAIYVITHDDIVRSGATSIPEILRLAPNLQVSQASASRYVITARGFGGVPAAQNFSNKLLVLIDGRSVYTPLFSGVYWDMQAVLPEDIDRIEVISGPGATLWGANAVNGVINITTRKAAETQGGFLRAGIGDRERGAALRYGGKIGDDLAYRVYARAYYDRDTLTTAGAAGQDHWSRPDGGFRFDWSPGATDTVTLQGDVYDGHESQVGAPSESINGHNLTARWSRAVAPTSSLQVQAYYDRAERGAEVDGSGFHVDTYDLDLQHAFALGARNDVVWGGGYRVYQYGIDGSAGLQWDPAGRTLTLANFFVQDSVSLGRNARLVLGGKLENDPYAGTEFLPNARLSWTPNEAVTLWAAASRAIRAPTPFDRDVVEKLGGSPFLIGGPSFQSEKLKAYELGTKLQASTHASLSLSAYYNDYEDLRSIEVAPGGFLPLRWGNGIKGRTYGVEAWGDYQATSWWRLSGSLNYMEETFKFAPGASGLLGVSQAANDPKYQASLSSAMTLGHDFTLDAALRYVSALPNPRQPSYTEMNARLGWNLTDRLHLAVTGRNLLHDQHVEYSAANAIPRSVFADLQWRF